MAKFKVSKTQNLIVVTQKQFAKINVNERELELLEKELPARFFRVKMPAKNRIEYTVPTSVNLETYIKNGLTVHKLYSILAQFGEVIKDVEQMGLYLHNIILEKKLIYVKEITGQVFFLYTPIINPTSAVNLYGFLADVLKDVKSDDAQFVAEHNKVMDFLNAPAHYSLSELEAFVQNEYPQIYQQITRRESGKSGFISSTQLGYMQHYHPSMALQTGSTIADDDIGTTLLMEEEGTTLLSYDDEEEGTTLLQTTVSAMLVRKKTGDTVTINQDVFRIGKDYSVDYVISDNNVISRKHATIYRNGYVFYIADDGSKNHTYVNGTMVVDGQVELHNGDVVRLANDEFEFFIS